MKFLPLCLILVVSVLSSCSSSDSKNKGRDPEPAMIYSDFKISGEEGNDSVTVMLQFRDESRDEENFRFKGENRVLLDGRALEQGQALMGGSYYELRLPAAGFEGDHRISFTDSKGKEHREDFHFEPLKLSEEIPDTIPKAALDLHFRLVSRHGLWLRVAITDTSYTGAGVNMIYPLTDGHIEIPDSAIHNLHTGPLLLQCWLEDERETTDPVLAGGLVTVTYGIRRRIYLR